MAAQKKHAVFVKGSQNPATLQHHHDLKSRFCTAIHDSVFVAGSLYVSDDILSTALSKLPKRTCQAYNPSVRPTPVRTLGVCRMQVNARESTSLTIRARPFHHFRPTQHRDSKRNTSSLSAAITPPCQISSVSSSAIKYC